MSKLRHAVEEISPDLANEYLLNNKLNRPLRLKWVLALSRQMSKNGQWHLSGEPIIFGRSGNLLDGQHRLKAIIHSGTTHPFLVVRGADDKTFSTIDTGQKRSPKDALFIAGFAQPLLYSKLGVNCLRWNRGIFFGGSNAAIAPTNDEIVEYCEDHRKEMAESVNHFMQVRSRLRKLVQGQVILFSYHKFKEVNENHAFLFIERLLTGVFNSPREQPIKLLRERLIQNIDDEAKLPTRTVYLMMFAAWNAYRQEKKIDNMALSSKQLGSKQGKIKLV